MAPIVHTIIKMKINFLLTQFLLLCQLFFDNFNTSKIQHLISNLKSNITNLTQIYSYLIIHIFTYFPIQIFDRIVFVSSFWYKYIWIFVVSFFAPKASAEGACIWTEVGYYGAWRMGYFGIWVILACANFIRVWDVFWQLLVTVEYDDVSTNWLWFSSLSLVYGSH